MKKKLLAVLLTVVMVVSLLPGTAHAAEALPDWYFLFAIFKNVDADCVDAYGKKTHTKYAMSQDEIDLAWDNAERFEAYMNNVGVMRAHVDVVEIDTPITKLVEYTVTDGYGSYAGAEQVAPLLKQAGIDLNRYDHVTCIASLAIYTGYLGMGGSLYENGTGHAFINFRSQSIARQSFASKIADYPKGTFVHEFLHVMESMSEKWGVSYNLHDIRDNFYKPTTDDYMTCYTDIILNRAKGNAGTGIPSVAWQCSPHTFRTMREFTVSDGVTAIGDYAFYGCGTLESVSIPSSVTRIGYAAFWDTSLKDVYYGGTQAQWRAIKMGEFNFALTNAAIHYNSTGPVLTESEKPTEPTEPAEPSIPASGTAYNSNQFVEVDGVMKEFKMYALKNEKGYDTNYIRIRDLANVLNGTTAQFNVGWANGAANIETKKAYDPNGSEMSTPFTGNRPYTVNPNPTNLDGVAIELASILLNDDNGGGYAYSQVKDLAAKLDFNAYWDSARGIICIETDKPYTGN